MYSTFCDSYFLLAYPRTWVQIPEATILTILLQLFFSVSPFIISLASVCSVREFEQRFRVWAYIFPLTFQTDAIISIEVDTRLFLQFPQTSESCQLKYPLPHFRVWKYSYSYILFPRFPLFSLKCQCYVRHLLRMTLKNNQTRQY